MLLGLLALLDGAHAADVLVTEATPATLDDFSVASMVYDMVVTAAQDQGVDLDDADAIRRWAGHDGDACFDNDACPANLWDRTDARLAIVMSVGKQIEGLDVTVRLHNVDDAAPLKVIHEIVPPGGETAFARRVASAAKDALPLLPARKPVSKPTLVFEDEEVPTPEPEERPPVHPRDPPRETPPAKPPRETPPRDEPVAKPRTNPDDERRKMGIPAAAYARYQASGLSRAEWLEKARVRVGRAFLELDGGWGLGDVDRGYGVRLRIQEAQPVFDTVGTASWEGAGSGAGATAGFAVGYAPAWFLDTSVAVSVQYGKKYLNAGWECAACEDKDDVFLADVTAVQGVIEPRVRLYPVATGVVKPYALVAFSVLLHDGFTVPDEGVDYPNTPAGAAFGPTAGLGLAIDPVSRVSVFLEVPGTWIAGPAPREVEEGTVHLEPGTLESSGFYARFVGGLGVRL